jgi:hypothetical protein
MITDIASKYRWGARECGKRMRDSGKLAPEFREIACE